MSEEINLKASTLIIKTSHKAGLVLNVTQYWKLQRPNSVCLTTPPKPLYRFA